MAEDKKSFLLYSDLNHTLNKLTDSDAGVLFKTILSYVNDENPIIDNLVIDIAFEPIKQQLKRDLRHWENIKVKRSSAGKASAESKRLAKENQQILTNSTSVDSVQQTSTHSTVNVNVNGNVINKDIYTNVDTLAIDFQKFIDWFNFFTKRNFKVTQKVKTALKSRLKDYSKSDILTAIENAHKDDYHIETNFKYLTPEFILRPDKIEKFLNAPVKQNTKSYSMVAAN